MSKCATHKVCFESKGLAEEALIQNQSQNQHRAGGGPINVYQCRDCGYYHFTSKGAVSDVLSENKHQISRNREASFWERKLR